MIARQPSPPSLPLICEPIKPPRGKYGAGWRWGAKKIYSLTRQAIPQRHHADDPNGAIAQHAVVRYVIGGWSRAELAADLGYSERQIQAYLSRRDYRPYTAPIFATFERLGISTGMGWGERSPRAREVVRAQRHVIRAALERPSDPQVLADMRLLSFVLEREL